MHSTSIWPSHSERCSGLPSMWWPLSRLRRSYCVSVLFVAVVFLAAEQLEPGAAAAAGPAEAEGRDGREPVRPAVHASRGAGTHTGPRNVEKRASLPDLRDMFSVTHGTTGRGRPKSCMICSSRAVSRSGSARKTLPSARRCSAPSTRAWRSRALVSCWLPLRCCAASQQRASPTKNFRHSSRVTSSFPSCTKRDKYEALREVSPLLASRTGLSTSRRADGRRRGQARRANHDLALLPVRSARRL